MLRLVEVYLVMFWLCIAEVSKWHVHDYTYLHHGARGVGLLSCSMCNMLMQAANSW